MSTNDDLVDEFKRRFPGSKAFEAIEASIQASFESYEVSRETAAAIAITLTSQMVQTVINNAPECVFKELIAAIKEKIETN